MKYILNRNKFIKESNENIDSICMKLGISDYEIVDGVVNVDGDVIICKSKLTELPFQFGKVTGNFNCSENRLKSLKGSPYYVGGDFECNKNTYLKSLEFGPKEVLGSFDAQQSGLTSLKGSPDKVGLDFSVYDNKITSLEHCTPYIGRDFDCSMNLLNTLEFGPGYVGRCYDCSINQLTNLIGSPDKVEWKFNCYDNKLTSLEGISSELAGYLDCTNNELTTLDFCPISINKLYCSNNPIHKWWVRVLSDIETIDSELLELFIDMGIDSNDPDEYNERRLKEILED
jgi:hypothetical protein